VWTKGLPWQKANSNDTSEGRPQPIYRPEFPFTVPNFLDRLAGTVRNSYPNIDLL
jgi:hypothetical protein